MNRLSSYSLFDGLRGRRPSRRFSSAPDRRRSPPPRPYKGQVLSYSADFIPVPTRIEEHSGRLYTVDEVSTCRLDEGGVGATKLDSRDQCLNRQHYDLLLEIIDGIPCRPGSSWVEHGFWIVNSSLIDDGDGFVKVYEFEDFVFEVSLPSDLRRHTFHIGTRDVADVLTLIWERIHDFHECHKGDIRKYSILAPPFTGFLRCKGFFDRRGERPCRKELLTPTRPGPPPRLGNEDDGQFLYPMKWRVRQKPTCRDDGSLCHNSSNVQRHQTLSGGGFREPRGPEGRYNPGIAAVDGHGRGVPQRGSREASRMPPGGQRPGHFENIRQTSGHDGNNSYSCAGPFDVYVQIPGKPPQRIGRPVQEGRTLRIDIHSRTATKGRGVREQGWAS